MPKRKTRRSKSKNMSQRGGLFGFSETTGVFSGMMNTLNSGLGKVKNAFNPVQYPAAASVTSPIPTLSPAPAPAPAPAPTPAPMPSSGITTGGKTKKNKKRKKKR